MFDKHKSSNQNTPPSQVPKVSQQTPAMGAAASVTPAAVALIGQGIIISGDVKADSSLKVEGRIEGRGVACSENVEIGETGHVTANIMAKVVKISGVVSGDIGGSEKVTISRTGRVQGNIIAPRVQLEDGALFMGSIDMNPAEPATATKPATVKRAAAEKGGKATAATPAQNKTGGTDAARKEPGLNLKSG